MESVRRRRMCKEGVWAECRGGGRDEKGRERWRKWIEIADALWGLQKINSSQEGKPQPPPCSLSLALLSFSLSLHSFFFHSVSVPVSLSSSVVSPFHACFQPCPLLLHLPFALFLSPTLLSLSRSLSSSTLSCQHCCAGFVKQTTKVDGNFLQPRGRRGLQTIHSPHSYLSWHCLQSFFLHLDKTFLNFTQQEMVTAHSVHFLKVFSKVCFVTFKETRDELWCSKAVLCVFSIMSHSFSYHLLHTADI